MDVVVGMETAAREVLIFHENLMTKCMFLQIKSTNDLTSSAVGEREPLEVLATVREKEERE